MCQQSNHVIMQILHLSFEAIKAFIKSHPLAGKVHVLMSPAFNWCKIISCDEITLLATNSRRVWKCQLIFMSWFFAFISLKWFLSGQPSSGKPLSPLILHSTVRLKFRSPYFKCCSISGLFFYHFYCFLTYHDGIKISPRISSWFKL